MDELVVRLTRTMACYERLRILSHLVANGETTPTALARQLRLAPNALSMHLSRLTTVGLIMRRRSAGWSYCIAESPYAESTLSGMTLGWLRSLLVKPQVAIEDCESHEVRNGPAADASERLHRLIFEAATAFTDLRRLQLLRHLDRNGDTAAPALCQKLHMSPWALNRHTDKLVRRGYLCSRTTESLLFYRIAKTFKTPIHARLWRIICQTWRRKPLRTS